MDVPHTPGSLGVIHVARLSSLVCICFFGSLCDGVVVRKQCGHSLVNELFVFQARDSRELKTCKEAMCWPCVTAHMAYLLNPISRKGNGSELCLNWHFLCVLDWAKFDSTCSLFLCVF